MSQEPSSSCAPVLVVSGRRKREGAPLLWGDFSFFCFSLAGSRSSGSNRSDGGGGRASKHQEEKAGAESKSGSGSESEYSTRSGGGPRGGALAGPGGEAASQRSQHSLHSHHSLHAAYAAPGGVPLAYNPMVVMMVPPPGPPAAAAVQPPGAPPVRDLGSVPPELTASRQSFHMAMGNPSEFFVDVM